MRSCALASLLLLLAACGIGSNSGDDPPNADTSLSAEEAFGQTCQEVRAGIAEFNQKDYAATVRRFEKARVPAAAYAEMAASREADALLSAVEYYAELAPGDYVEAARSSASFARNKEITLGQCVSNEPLGGEAPTPAPTPV